MRKFIDWANTEMPYRFKSSHVDFLAGYYKWRCYVCVGAECKPDVDLEDDPNWVVFGVGDYRKDALRNAIKGWNAWDKDGVML